MADTTAAQAVRDAEARLQEQQLDFDKTEFYYRAHVKSVVDVYNSENKEVPIELREQADRATHNIQEAKKVLASRRDDLRMARIRHCAHRTRHADEAPEVSKRDADASPAENRKRGPPDGLLPRIAKRLQTNHVHSSQPEPGRTAALLALLMDGTLAPGPRFSDRSLWGLAKHEEVIEAYFKFDDEEFDKAAEEQCADLLEAIRVLLTQESLSSDFNPDQMDIHTNITFDIPAEFMSYLAHCAYRLRMDSHVIGRVAMSISNGSASSAEMDDFRTSLDETFPYGQLHYIFEVPREKDWTDTLFGLLASPESEVVEDTVCRLLLTATILAKYSCLVTSVAVAFATSFKPKGELAEDAVRASAITETLEHHKEVLNCFRAVKAQAPQVVLEFVYEHYDPFTKVGYYLKKIGFGRRLGPLFPELPALVTFLSTPGYS
ncbi:hypothetical protein PG991_006255 [Apiospora marii]|uniref:Uncharacterized protein n=1 Tax=Apiospora marii TaxID=335849 RepID=A0ABR1SBJ5_9PEZI